MFLALNTFPQLAGWERAQRAVDRAAEFEVDAAIVADAGQPFLTLNGIQTQSAQTYNLIRDLDDLSQLGVDVLRISPQSANTFTIVVLFRQCLDRAITPDLAARQMESLLPAAACNGYWHGERGFEQVVASTPCVGM